MLDVMLVMDEKESDADNDGGGLVVVVVVEGADEEGMDEAVMLGTV